MRHRLVIKGRDAQLEKAVKEIVLEELTQNPPPKV
jgi:hypothetical protein